MSSDRGTEFPFLFCILKSFFKTGFSKKFTFMFYPLHLPFLWSTQQISSVRYLGNTLTPTDWCITLNLVPFPLWEGSDSGLPIPSVGNQFLLTETGEAWNLLEEESRSPAPAECSLCSWILQVPLWIPAVLSTLLANVSLPSARTRHKFSNGITLRVPADVGLVA